MAVNSVRHDRDTTPLLVPQHEQVRGSDEDRLTPGRQTVDLQRELLQNRHRFIGVMHLEEGLRNKERPSQRRRSGSPLASRAPRTLPGGAL